MPVSGRVCRRAPVPSNPCACFRNAGNACATACIWSVCGTIHLFCASRLDPFPKMLFCSAATEDGRTGFAASESGDVVAARGTWSITISS